MKRSRFLVLGLILVTVSFIYYITKDASDNKKYFNDLNLNLKGEVLATDVQNGFNGFGIVRVKIVESNINFYDPRGKSRNYYCIIKNGFAEIYQHGISECEIGDTITVDTKKREFKIFKKDGNNVISDIVLYTNDFFYKYLQKHQKL